MGCCDSRPLDPDDPAPREGEREVHAAARVGDVARLQRCDVLEFEQIFPGQNMTPLMLAAHYGRRDAVRHLVERGANVFAAVIECAAERGDTEIVEYLMDVGGARLESISKTLRKVCCNRDAAMAVLLVERGAWVDWSVAIAACEHLPEDAARKVLAHCTYCKCRPEGTATMHPLLTEFANARRVEEAKMRAEEAKMRAEKAKTRAEKAKTLLDRKDSALLP